MTISIGRPTPRAFTSQAAVVREHVRAWRIVLVGKVEWESVKYRDASEPVEIPKAWVLRSSREWALATLDPSVGSEHDRLTNLLARVSAPWARPILVRLRHLVLSASDTDVMRTVAAAEKLEQGCARGKPLRLLQLAGLDTKFLERNRALLSQLLDARFDGAVSDQGLEAFLDALPENDHWLLVAELQPKLLPYTQMRVRATELQTRPLPADHIIIVENERSLHQLPVLPDTIAVLGAGLDLTWMRCEWLRTKRLAYWGDIDTWGLTMLAAAREFQPHLSALLMTREVLAAHAHAVVEEDQRASELPPANLDAAAQELYKFLWASQKGRLEQEYVSPDTVKDALIRWRGSN